MGAQRSGADWRVLGAGCWVLDAGAGRVQALGVDVVVRRRRALRTLPSSLSLAPPFPSTSLTPGLPDPPARRGASSPALLLRYLISLYARYPCATPLLGSFLLSFRRRSFFPFHLHPNAPVKRALTPPNKDVTPGPPPLSHRPQHLTCRYTPTHTLNAFRAATSVAFFLLVLVALIWRGSWEE